MNVNPFLTATNGDSVDNGWLRLTTVGPDQSASAVYNGTFFAANTEIIVSFDFAIWSNGGSGNGRADGIGFFLYDGSVPFAVGASGGSLGYAQKTVAPVNEGLAGGYFGIGIDNWGNFSNPTEGRIGGPGFISNAVAVRGPGSGFTGYEYITGTTSLPTLLDFPTYRPTNTADYRNLQIYLNRDNILTVSLKAGTNAYQVLFEADLSSFTRPETLGFGFFGGTGGAFQYHDIRNVSLTNITAYQWDNDLGNGLWGVSNNWVGPQVVPDLCSLTNTVNTNTTGALPMAGADIIFSDVYVSTNQTVNLGGQTWTNRAIEVDGVYSYTLTNGTLRMDGMGLPGELRIRSSNNGGDSAHTIAANIVMTSNMTLEANAESFLTLSGVINNGGHTLQSVGEGRAIITGSITNTGGVSQSGRGLLVLAGSNTYSGDTRASGGTLGIGGNNVLGTGVLRLQGGTVQAYGGARTVTNAVTITQNSVINGTNDLTFTGSFTNSGRDNQLTIRSSGNTVFSGNVVLSESTTNRTLIINRAGELQNMTISGVISDGASSGSSLAKARAGTLFLSGSNTYSGTTFISGGVIQITSSDRLSDNSSMQLTGGGRFNLGGTNSERIRTLSFNGGGIDFGTVGTSNYFMFSNAGTVSGPLAVFNHQTGVDRLAFQTAATSTVTATVLNNIYFSGEGSGAFVSANNQTISGYGGGWSFISGPTNAWNVWTGTSSTNWNVNGNWSLGTSPNTTTARVSFEGGTQTNVNVDANNRTLNVMRFNTNASAYTIGGGQSGQQRLQFTGILPSIIQMSTNQQTITSRMRFDSEVIIDVYAGAGDLRLSGAIDGANGFFKYGTGRLILDGSANNTFAGDIHIYQGSVNVQKNQGLGAGGNNIIVYEGGTLELQGGITLSTFNSLTIGCSGFQEGGAIRNVSGVNTINNTITMSCGGKIQSDAGTLIINGGIFGNSVPLAVGGAGNITISGAITNGTGQFTKYGTGTLTFTGTVANNYTGNTVVQAGTLNLHKSAGVTSIQGDLFIGGQGTNATVHTLANNQISTNATIHVESQGTLHISNTTQVVGRILADSNSVINLGTGTLTNRSSQDSLMNGLVTGSGSLVKDGIGRLTIGGSNSYTGATTVARGIMRIEHENALGTTNGATTVNSGASLEILSIGNNQMNIAENLTINGTGQSVEGALRNLKGTNTWSGNITVGTGGARINTDSGRLTIAGVVNSTNQSLTNGGFGKTVFANNVNLGTGNFVKDGPGHTILSNMTLTASQTRVTEGSMIIKGQVTNTGALTVDFGTSMCIDTPDVVGGNRLVVNGNMTNAGTINLKFETGGATSGNSNGFHGIDFNGAFFTNTGTIFWSFDAPPSGGFGTVDNPYYGGMRSSNNIFAAYMTGNYFNSGFVAVGLTGDQFLTTYYDGTYYYLAVIPEPRTYGLMGFGLIMTLYGLRIARKKKQNS
ncbi:autotransporter-associated beta strand repeat-containing protein [Oscillatoria laete-virens NRMC-F 0139]|nr:autotransporter-associated beta strand repeat-containing protein [Oscillatoria laete-virens NRMC-F 0139]